MEDVIIFETKYGKILKNGNRYYVQNKAGCQQKILKKEIARYKERFAL